MERGWIFLSHSHQDIDKVRLIRNQFEKLGFEPLMFYLKCLSDKDEIVDLIKREIDSREWFIYLDSPNARTSNWVKTERDYIAECSGKKVFAINLEHNLESQIDDIDSITKQIKAYISYARRDISLATSIHDYLKEKGLFVYWDNDIPIGSDWSITLSGAINDVSHNGIVLLIISENSLKSPFVKHEIEYTKQQKGKIVPVCVNGAKLTDDFMKMIGNYNIYHISGEPTKQELDTLYNNIINSIKYENDFREKNGFRTAQSIKLPDIGVIDKSTFAICENLKEVTIPDSVVHITDDAFADFPDVLIKCSAQSYARRYCEKKRMKYEII